MKKTISMIVLSTSLVFGTYDITEAPLTNETKQDKKTKSQLAVIVITLAERQNMLIQKMAKEALYVLKGINMKENRANLLMSVEIFDKTLKGLLNGDEELGLVKTENKKITEQLMTVSNLWVELKEGIRKGDIKVISKLNMPLLENMNKAVQMYKDNISLNLNPGTIKTINMAGMQRMLTQKMTKELLLAANGIEADTNIGNAKNTFELFKNTLASLTNKTKDEIMSKQLVLIKNIMQEYETIVMRGDISDKALRLAQRLNMRMLKESNNAVKIYEATIM